jgi:hypothetical protein
MIYRYSVDRLMVMSVRAEVSRLLPQARAILDILMTAKNPDDIADMEILSLMGNNSPLSTEGPWAMWKRYRTRLIRGGFISETKE